MTTGSDKINKSSNDVCAHTDTVFVGIQYDPHKHLFLHLFNCKSCQSTIVLPALKVNSDLKP